MKKYEAPKLDIIVFAVSDIITTSNPWGNETVPDDFPRPGVNETPIG